MTRDAMTASLLMLLWAAGVSAQDVPFDKYKLPNNMTVILHEDHTLPIACVNLWYRVGSKDEAAGRSGFAHLFEHLMFMGTDRVPGAAFDQIMEAGGGWNNASTSEDRTNFFSMGPAELLPTLLWLDADRLESLGRAMTQEKLDKQRAIVRNERRQSIENQPYGRAELEVYKLMYPKDHPYWGTVIGSHEDLEAATLEDVKNFFAAYYVPSNASVVVAGDFDPAQIKPLLDRLFGTLPRGSDVAHAAAQPVKLSAVKRQTMTDVVQYPRMYMVYHSPAHFAAGDAEMDLAADVLAKGITSRLYQKLIYSNPLATDVSAYQSSMLLGSMFYIQVTAQQDRSLDEIEQAIDQVVAEFVERGPTDEELQRTKAQFESLAVAGLESLLAKADRLNMYEFHLGQPGSFRWDLDRYRQATPASVRQWAAQVLTPDARLVMRVIPELEPSEPDPRDQRPAAMSPRTFTPALPVSFTLSNGITVHHWPRHELPRIAATMMLRNGSAHEPTELAGLARLTASMLDQGAGQRSAIEFSEALDLLGASFAASADHQSTQVSLAVLARNFEPALALFADAILRPRMEEKEWQRVHRLQLESLRQALDVPAVVANQVGRRAFFGARHPYGRPAAGTVDTVESMTLAAVTDWHRRAYDPSQAVLLVAGDITTEQLKKQLDTSLGIWSAPPGAQPPAAPVFPPLAHEQLRVVLVDRPDAVQTVIRFLMPAPPYASPNRQELDLLGTILGGSFTSRLNQNLREAKGYTYGARCSYVMDRWLGYFAAEAAVRADVTGPAVSEFLKEFQAIRGGDIRPAESEKAQATAHMALIQSLAGLSGTVSHAITLILNDRPFTQLADDLAEMRTITADQLNQLARDALPLEQAVLVLVGDKRVITEQLKPLKLPPPEEWTATGQPLKTAAAPRLAPRLSRTIPVRGFLAPKAGR